MPTIHAPIYVQIRDALAERIQSGDLRPGSRIPSERALSFEYRTSRMTVRQAIIDLVNRGFLQRRRGSGTYVAEPKITQTVNVLLGFSEQMEQKGIIPGARLLELKVVPAHAGIADPLIIAEGELVYRIVRLRTGNGQPMALEHSFFPLGLCRGLDRFNLERRSIYRILREEYGLTLTRAVQTLEPTVADEFESHVLQVPAGSPLMLLERVAFTDDGRAVEYAKDLYRGDRSRFVAEMTMTREPDAVGTLHSP